MLFHLVNVRHADLVAFEGGQGKLPVDEIDVPFEVGNDEVPTPACACRDVYLLERENRL